MAERLSGNLLEKRCTVYVLHDEDESPLYVGLSTRMMARLGQHSIKPWWRDVSSARFEHFPDAWAARAREAELIRALAPPHNTDFAPKEQAA